jgi:dethiobiotin synthetase
LALGLFFTGTDTGVGKTVVTAAVARILRGQGRGVLVCKPVATEAILKNGRLVSEDTLRLAQAAGAPDLLEKVTPWTFPDPVAPPVAARRAGVALKLSEIVRAVQESQESEKAMLVEGIGGLMCPLTERETVADLAKALHLPLVVVARRSLGTLNHTLLTLEVARARRLPVAGVVINETTPPHTLAEATNVVELQQRIEVPVLATVPHQPEPDSCAPDCLADVDWWKLCRSF